MNSKTILSSLKKMQYQLDWKLLLFLLLFLNVKLAIKIPAILLIYILQFDFKFGFAFKNSRLPLFYPLIIGLALLGFVLNKSYAEPNYLLVLLTGIGFWILCILAVHQVKLAVDRNDVDIIQHTILLFFILNIIVSFFNLALIINETGAINPYTYQGQYQKYFIGTGDYIRGLTFDTSTTNAVLNAFGVLYFLTKKNMVMLLLCLIVLFLTGSNFINLTMLLILGLLFIFKSSRDQKSLIAICIAALVLFMVKISPQNNQYVIETVSNILHKKHAVAAQPTVKIKADDLLSLEERKQKAAIRYLDSVRNVQRKTAINLPVAIHSVTTTVTDTGRIDIPKPDINSAPYQGLVSTPLEQRPLLKFIHIHQSQLPISGQTYKWSPMPGKAIGFYQTINYFKNHPSKFITGAGAGNFSSKLAFKVSGLGITGGYPARYAYIHPDFLSNHLDLYLNFFSKRAGLHSLTNSPFSVYDQLFAEYGLAGLLVFLIWYLGYFAKHRKALTYGIPISLLLLAVLLTDYWFEQLSVLVFFELLLLLDIKESRTLSTQS